MSQVQFLAKFQLLQGHGVGLRRHRCGLPWRRHRSAGSRDSAARCAVSSGRLSALGTVAENYITILIYILYIYIIYIYIYVCVCTIMYYIRVLHTYSTCTTCMYYIVLHGIIHKHQLRNHTGSQFVHNILFHRQ